MLCQATGIFVDHMHVHETTGRVTKKNAYVSWVTGKSAADVIRVDFDRIPVLK